VTVTTVLLLAWFVVVLFWLVNHYHRENFKYELEYRNGKHPHWEAPESEV